MANQIKKETIHAQGISIQVYTEDFKNDFISLTDIAQKHCCFAYKLPEFL